MPQPPQPPPAPAPPMLVPWALTEINGRPLNLFAKDGEANDRLQVSEEVRIDYQRLFHISP